MKVYLAGYSPQHAIVNSFPPFPGGGLTALHSSANSNPFSVDFLASKTSLAAKRAWANSTSHYQWFKIYSSNMNIFTKITENSDIFWKNRDFKTFLALGNTTVTIWSFVIAFKSVSGFIILKFISCTNSITGFTIDCGLVTMIHSIAFGTVLVGTASSIVTWLHGVNFGYIESMKPKKVKLTHQEHQVVRQHLVVLQSADNSNHSWAFVLVFLAILHQ